MRVLGLLPVCLSLALHITRGDGVQTVKLNNGVEMPVMALGVNIWDAGTCKSATTHALNVGIRNIWSSELVGASCQRAQGEAIKASGVPRVDIFLAGTVNSASCSDNEGCYKMTKRLSEAQYQVLAEDTLDMLMLDYPPRSGGCPAILGMWRAFEEFYAAKKARTIAVSNFDLGQLQCILDNTSATVPAANQMIFSVGHGSSLVVEENAKLGINLQAYTPLGGQPPGNAAHSRNAVCKRIGQKHGKTAAQVSLRWIVQRGATICVASKKLDHLRENNDIFDFNLSEDEMAELNAVGQKGSQPFGGEL